MKSFRTELRLSLRELSKKSGIAVSYLSEIESGKKYPKPDKLLSLSQALEVDYDQLVSTKVDKNLDPFAALINSDLIKLFPFHLFGISAGDILGLFKNNPENAQAFLQTFLQIGRAYDMSLENFLFAALRTWLRQRNNYFPNLEKLARQSRKDHGIDSGDSTYEQLSRILLEKYSYQIEETDFANHPELREFRSILKDNKLLCINTNLLPSQKAFILAREIGFNELSITERPLTSSWIKVQSFDKLVNNFKASYFGGALLLPRDPVAEDINLLLEQKEWNTHLFTSLLDRHQATPEMLLYRMSQLLPGVFGLKDIFYFRFTNSANPQTIKLTKELNMTETLVPFGLGFNEHYCRRLMPLRLLNQLRHEYLTVTAGAQKVTFVKDGTQFLLLSMARPLSLSKERGSAIALGIKIDRKSATTINFLNDKTIDTEEVSETCERCPLTNCSERVVEASIISDQMKAANRKEALQKFLARISHQ